MQNLNFTKTFLTLAFILALPLVSFSQENKKEVHLKIVENGIVTKDTVYTTTGEVEEMDHYVIARPHHAGQPKHIEVEKYVITLDDSTHKDFEWTEKDMKQFELTEKEMKEFEWTDNDMKEFQMHIERRNLPHRPHVEEIWLGKPDNGVPCRTIIIHEGDCPEHVFLGDDLPEPPAPPHDGEKIKHSETKVIRTEGGTKVMIIETDDDSGSIEKTEESKKEKGKK